MLCMLCYICLRRAGYRAEFIGNLRRIARSQHAEHRTCFCIHVRPALFCVLFSNCFQNVSNKLHLPFLLRMMVLNKVSDHRRCGRWGFFPKSWDPGKFHCYPVVLIADRKTLGSFTFPLVNPPFGEPTGAISYLFDALQHIQDLHLTNIDGNNFIPWFPCLPWFYLVLSRLFHVISCFF